MLEKQFIQDYFNADFRDIDSLLNDVLVPIFGSFDPGFDEITLSRDAKEKAAQSRIKKIKHVATLPAMGMDIKVFDVTLDSRCHIHRARKGIQMLIRQYVEKFEGAFIVFHYEDPANRSWRFSYLEKRESNVASTNAKRYTYLCGKQYPCRTLAERFEGLQKQDLTAINLEKAFSVETLSDEFFNEYRNFYQDLVNFVKYEDNLIDGFVEYAKGDKELAEKYARDYIKKLMGRLVFIQFLQNKAWLKEDIHYTHTLFNSCTEEQKYDFLDNVLEPLFFGVFNTPKDAREVLFHQEHWDMNLYNEWKNFPYLNGGLFECDELDKLSLPLPSYFFSNQGKEDKVRKPNDEFYSDACGIFDFFDRYNFTIDESDPLDREIGVDPEMLGKIFENLLEDNKDKGAFYTPKEIVDYMCKEALTAYLIDEARKKSEVNKQRQENFEDAIRAFVNDPEMTVKRIQQYDDKQLIDLDESLRDVKICDPAIGSGAFPMGLLNLLMACRTAVNDALRKGEPRYLLKKEIIQNNIYGVDIEKGAIDIARLRFWLSIVVDLEEPEALPNFDYKFMQGNSLLEQYKGVDLSTLTQNKKEQHEALQVSMFDDQLDILRKTLRKYLDDYFLTTDHQIKTRLRQQIKDNVNQQLHEQHIRVDFPEQYDIAANTDFFLWHTWFADVFNRASKQGFDIVIGNPPYIRRTSLAEKDKTQYEKSFSSAQGQYDIYLLFIEHGINLVTTNGVVCYINPIRYFNADYGKECRKFIMKNCSINFILDISQLPVFQNAMTYPCVNMFIKSGISDKVMYCKLEDLKKIAALKINHYLNFSKLHFSKPEDYKFIIPQNEYVASIIEKIDSSKLTIETFFNNARGLANNKVDFSGSEYTAIKSKSAQRYHILDKITISTLHSERFSDEMIILPRTIQELKATIKPKGLILLDRIYYLIPKMKVNQYFVLGVLNAKITNYWFEHYYSSTKVSGNYFDLNGNQIASIPIPRASEKDQQIIAKLVIEILNTKENNHLTDTIQIEQHINEIIYKLYDLTDDEIKLIEQA